MLQRLGQGEAPDQVLLAVPLANLSVRLGAGVGLNPASAPVSDDVELF